VTTRNESRQAAAIVFLNQLPRWLIFVAVLALSVGGLFLPAPIGPVLLLLLGGALFWLATWSWPRLSPPERVLRIAAPAILVLIAFSRLG
jgi:hypothetical protein